MTVLSPDRAEEARDRRLCRAILAGALLLHVLLVTVGWNRPLLDAHPFRQTQTALTAQALAEGDWRLDYPLPLFGPPWSAPFEFPLYQAAVAALTRATGWPLESAGRAVALLFLWLTLPAVYLLQRHLPIPRARWPLLPALVALTPAYLFYSRTFLIESAALCAGAWFLVAFGRALESGGAGRLAAAAALGVAAALAKSTTFAVFLVAAVALVVVRLRSGGAAVTVRRALLLALPGLAAAVGWNHYADAVKASNPLSEHLVSGQLTGFLFGDWTARTDPEAWAQWARHATAAIGPGANALLAVVFGLLLAPRRAAFVLCAGGAAAIPLLLFNLHRVHDYYFYASGPLALAALALAWSNLWDLRQFPLAARVSVVLLSLGLQVGAYWTSYRQLVTGPVPSPPELATLVDRFTGPADIVVVIGQDWDPTMPYHARRRALMVTDVASREPERLERVLARLGSADRIGALVVSGNHRNQPEPLRLLAARLGLRVTPVASDGASQLYVRPETADRLTDLAQGLELRAFTLLDLSADVPALPRRRFDGAALGDVRFAQLFSPRPREIRHPFDLAFHDLEGRLALDAHVPADIDLDVPPGSRSLELEFGILDGAWRTSHPTDGVEFVVEFRRTRERPPTVLFRRRLDPVNSAADRGAQQATVRLPADATGEIRLRTLPGPAASIASDWAYWRRAELR